MFRNKLIVICLLFVAGGSILINGQVVPMIPEDASHLIPNFGGKEAVPNEALTPTTTVSTTTTTPPKPTTPTTPKPTTPTTPKPTTPTTPKPTTPTTPKPTTPTTPKPTTPTTPKPTTPTTTTVAPVTTTTTTPKPNPVPIVDPPIGRWNSSCILLQMATQLNFTYETADNKTARGIYNIPANATVHDFNCESNNTQEITLMWGPINAIHMMSIYFERNNSNVNVHSIVISLPIDAEEFNNPKANQSVQLVYLGDIFTAPSKMSYHCTRPQVFNMTETINETKVIGTIRLSDVQMEAFRTDNSTSFSAARDCDSTNTADIVPIAVGIALVALILIVLISYLCARSRSTARGYMSF